MIFLSPELWGNYNCSWKLQLWLEKTKALLEKTSLSVTIGPTTVKLVNIELKKTLSNAEKAVFPLVAHIDPQSRTVRAYIHT